MKRLRRKEPFGKAGLTVAICALVLALVGGAYAAGGLTKSQEKQVTKIAKKYAGKPGAPGATGAAGAAGKEGPQGKAGNNGTNGESVTLAAADSCPNGGTKATVGAVSKEICNGTNGTPGIAGKSVTATEIPTGEFECEERGGAIVEEEGGVPIEVCSGEKGEEGSPWTLGGTLPAGETLKGAWSIDTHTTGTEPVYTTASFGLPLAAAPSAHYINEGSEELTASGTQASTKCHGSVAAPSADAGNLCVYAGGESGISTNEPFNNFLIHWKWGIAVNASKLGGSVQPNTAAVFGFGVTALSEGETLVGASGTWAVTEAE
jgi:hypothetical protein